MTVYWISDEEVGANHGCLEPYGGESLKEDVATFMEPLAYDETPQDILKRLEGINEMNEHRRKLGLKEVDAAVERRKSIERSSHLSPLYFADPSDARYAGKLELLRDYGFLTTGQHELLSERLGSLHHLLKEVEVKK